MCLITYGRLSHPLLSSALIKWAVHLNPCHFVYVTLDSAYAKGIIPVSFPALE
jgi:hypothetical protein